MKYRTRQGDMLDAICHRHYLESKSTGKLYMAVIKTTENGDENYLASFRQTTDKDMQRKERQGRLIRKWKD